jgi:hypothetical protein
MLVTEDIQLSTALGVDSVHLALRVPSPQNILTVVREKLNWKRKGEVLNMDVVMLFNGGLRRDAVVGITLSSNTVA